jgi:LacI family transcriptional regulator
LATPKTASLPSPKKRLPRPSANAVTIRDVARTAAVSVATVSRALNGSIKVAESLRLRVQQVAIDLGYTPHAAARALATQRSRTIGAVIPTLANVNFAVGINALQRKLAESDYILLLASSNYDLQDEFRQVTALAAQGAAGMMLVGARHAPGLYAFLEARRIPFVNTWVLDDDRPSVGFDNREIGRTVANHLLDLGHRHIGLLAQLPAQSDRAAGRIEGIREALAARGAPPAKERLIEDSYGITEGQLGLRALLQAEPRITAVICATDTLAFGVLSEAKLMGLAVPAQLSVTGINDTDFAAHLTPPLTTVRLPADEIGLRAGEYLLGQIAGLPVPSSTPVQISLMVRASTARAPGRSRK